MRTEHVSHAEIERFARGELPPEAILRVMRHLGECAECTEHARKLAAETYATDVEHPPVDTDLTAYVDGTMPQESRAAVAEHLLSCARCREDAADLAHLRKTHRSSIWYAAAAAAIVILAATTLLTRSPHPTIRPVPPTHPVVRVAPPPPYERAEWNEAVRDALQSGNIERPAILAELRPPRSTVRGNEQTPSATMEPAGVVIETTRPRLSWTAFKGAHYVVSIFNGHREVTSSAKLTSPSWTPPAPLPRDTRLTWQVEVIRDDNSEIIPAPPAPPAMFRIISDDTEHDLEEARRLHPDDHLLLGVLYARAGLQGRAEEELGRGDSIAAQHVLSSVSGWH